MKGTSGRVGVHVLSAELSILDAIPDHCYCSIISTDKTQEYPKKGKEEDTAVSYCEKEAPTRQLYCLSQHITLTGTRDANLIASDNHNLLSCQKFLGNDTAEAAKKMVAPINNFCIRQYHDERTKA